MPNEADTEADAKLVDETEPVTDAKRYDALGIWR
jgi:hypothetical protein